LSVQFLSSKLDQGYHSADYNSIYQYR